MALFCPFIDESNWRWQYFFNNNKRKNTEEKATGMDKYKHNVGGVEHLCNTDNSVDVFAAVVISQGVI